jgi:L-threonylcarbamoyladenylate synthase
MDNSNFLSECTFDKIELAAQKLHKGQLVAFPTETVYGLGADGLNASAVKRIYKVKARPSNHPLIIHISTFDLLHFWVSDIPEYALTLARDFWPGPMTLVLKKGANTGDYLTGGQDSVAIRVPNEPTALALLRAFEFLGGKGVAAPSANRFGQVSPTSAKDVLVELGDYLVKGDLVLDGGYSKVGIESSIIDCTSELPRILRPGAISPAMVNESTGLITSDQPVDIRVSGSFLSHYSPKANVILDVRPSFGQGFIALADVPTPPGVIRISSPVDIEEFAQVLYQSFRLADSLNLKELVIHQPEGENLAAAIRDRLRKASS